MSPPEKEDAAFVSRAWRPSSHFPQSKLRVVSKSHRSGAVESASPLFRSASRRMPTYSPIFIKDGLRMTELIPDEKPTSHFGRPAFHCLVVMRTMPLAPREP